MRFRLAFEIVLEVGGQRNQSLLLTGNQPGTGVLDRRHRRRKVDAVQGQASFSHLDRWLWRGRGWRRVLDDYVGRGRALSPRESVQLAVTAIAPGDTPAVFSVAEAPVPETVPLIEVQVATLTGTPSGLVQLAVKATVPPAATLAGLAAIDIVGMFFGGGGFTMKSAEQLT